MRNVVPVSHIFTSDELVQANRLHSLSHFNY